MNDLLTWVKGKHTLKFGGEYKNIGGNVHTDGGLSGTFNFSRAETGLPQVAVSGNEIASFLLEHVDNANYNILTTASDYPRQIAVVWNVGDTWRATPKLSVNLGVRWDYYSPSAEKYDRQAFFDPLSPNPGAGGRLGRLAFAGSKWGDASFGRRTPEYPWRKGYGPRLGIAYSLNPRTVIRTGYGIFYTQAFYPGWGGGIDQSGFNSNYSLGSPDGGLTPAFLLSQGFPAVPANQMPPFIDASFRNGRGINYRPFDANRLAYLQQWNLTVERQFTDNFHISAAYVGSKGTRLPSITAGLNALNPSLLSMGNKLLDTYSPGMTSLDGVPVPYDGWIEQLTAAGCTPNVAQALLPYPQYCSQLNGLNENAGNSTYHSFQFKAERRFAGGAYMLAAYTWSRTIASSDTTQQTAANWNSAWGSISPYERQRNKGLATDDVPHILSVTFVYDLPFGRGKRFLNAGGIVDKLMGGWEMSGIFRASSGTPFFFRAGSCAGGAQSYFDASCIPGILPGASPWAQDKGSFDPGKGLLFNAKAFEPVSAFTLPTDPDQPLYLGSGARITNVRGFGYHDQSFALIKNIKLTERLNFQLRGEFFNIWNWHRFNIDSRESGGLPFNTDITSPDFGKWGGGVTNPRNIQVAARLTF